MTMNRGADASTLLALRKKFKAAREADASFPNITLNDMVAYVVAQNLPRFPAVNGIFEKGKGKFEMYSDAHLAIAVDTDRGLMVPVMRAAQHLRLGELSTCLADLVGQCRGGAIDPEYLQGGTFTISNLGVMGVQSFTPILNTPQVAILGVCSIEKVAAPDGAGGVNFVPTLGLSLTIDHQDYLAQYFDEKKPSYQELSLSERAQLRSAEPKHKPWKDTSQKNRIHRDLYLFPAKPLIK